MKHNPLTYDVLEKLKDRYGDYENQLILDTGKNIEMVVEEMGRRPAAEFLESFKINTDLVDQLRQEKLERQPNYDIPERKDIDQFHETRLLDYYFWPTEFRSATTKQIDCIRKMAKATDTDLPENHLFSELGIRHAGKIIQYLIDKKETQSYQTPLTAKQEWLLNKLSDNGVLKGYERQSIADLSLRDASTLIGQCKSQEARVSF